MNCWGIRIYFTRSRFSLNGGFIVYMELLSGHERIITKSGISLYAGTINRGSTVYFVVYFRTNLHISVYSVLLIIATKQTIKRFIWPPSCYFAFF
jgi:hypothetical protein